MMIATRMKGNKDQLFDSEENLDDHQIIQSNNQKPVCVVNAISHDIIALKSLAAY